MTSSRRMRSGEPAASVHPALVSYRRRTKRLMGIYAVALTLIVGAVLGLVKLAYVRGELSHVSARSAAAAAPIPAVATAAALTLRWHTDDLLAGGTPYADGIVVTYTAHTVNGRDALTGAVRWHYTRSDKTICSVLQQDPATIAVYKRGGNCDEIAGLTTATGGQRFFRTVADNGVPAFASAANVVLIVTPAAVHVIDNAGGLDRWTWSPPSGCRVLRALTGSLGVLTSYQCGVNYWLSLHALTDDQQIWASAVSAPLVPLTASAVLGAVDLRTGQVLGLAASNGGLQAKFATVAVRGLTLLPAAQASVSSFDTTGVLHELVYDARLISIVGPGRQRWTATADGPPTVNTPGAVYVVVDKQVSLLNAGTGRLERQVRLTSSPAGDRVLPIGSGLLVLGNTAGGSYFG